MAVPRAIGLGFGELLRLLRRTLEEVYGGHAQQSDMSCRRSICFQWFLQTFSRLAIGIRIELMLHA